MISLRRNRIHRTAADPLAAADELIAQGRALEAIDLLTEANRRARCFDSESRLVHLRHMAFESMPIGEGLPDWPPDAPDLFPGVQLPEVAPSDFTAETLRSGILRHGCLVVRGLVPPERVATLVDDVEGSMNAFEAWEQNPSAAASPWFVPFDTGPGCTLRQVRKWVTGGGGVWTVDSPRALFDALETFYDVGIAEPLTAYLGERPALSVKKWTLRRVPVTSGTNWHQDGAFLGQGIRTVNFWLTLSHCGDDAPALDIVPRRMHEILPTGTEGAIFDWSVGDAVVERVARDAPIMRPVFEPGDAVFFDERFLHRTAVSPSMTHERYAIESWFFAPSRYPHDQVPLVF
jgi:hypothetical protein